MISDTNNNNDDNNNSNGNNNSNNNNNNCNYPVTWKYRAGLKQALVNFGSQSHRDGVSIKILVVVQPKNY